MNAVVQPIYTPDAESMRTHLEHLFGGYLDGCHEGLIELSWTETKPDDAGRYRLSHARLYATDKIEELIEEAARLNSQPMRNVYIGAALRFPDTAPFGRAKDSDAWALTCGYVDLDDPGAATAAKDIYGPDKPTLVVVTGRAPHTRAQMWWRLEEPITDSSQWPALLGGIAAKLNGDTTVTNPSRVMRLAGTIAWPVKPGRTIELTTIVALKQPGPPTYTADRLAAIFPPVAAGGSTAPAVMLKHTTNGLGLVDKIIDGRESYMRNTISACLIEYIGENGCTPSAKELAELAWPQYERKVDLTRGGRGAGEFAQKCAYTVARFERGDIRGIETLDKAVDVYKRKAANKPAIAPPAALPPPAKQDTAIKTTDFVTLLTEEVEEVPDLIEPGFAGPGSFVLIAGPPKAQKSFLLQEMLVGAATGASFLNGLFKCPRPLRVFYLQAEMNRKLLRKRAREFKMLTADEKAMLNTNLIISDRFHMILNEGGVKVVVDTIRAAYPDTPPDIIAIDPLANVFDQENENDNTQLMRFLTGRVEAVRQAINPDAAVVMVHHATKRSSEDMARDPFIAIRGAGALRGYYDSAIVIFRASEESKARKVHFELRDGESPEPMTVELVNGRFMPISGSSTIDKAMARLMLAAIHEAWEAERPLSMHRQARTEGRYAVFNLSQKFRIKPKEVDALLNDWLMNGVVMMQPKVSRGRPSGLQVVGTID